MATKNDVAVDPQLWLACAGPLVRLPPVNSAVYYFPQGHADNAACPPEFSAALAGIAPPIVRCRLAAVLLSADPSSDEVFARMSLVPVLSGAGAGAGAEAAEPRERCAKVLTQSDANNGGGFSVPKVCAERIFPALDYRAEPPVQEILPRDVHGKEWTFRHIFRGTPRRHLLTSGWSVFVNDKSLVAGDCVVFAKTAAGGIGVGVRRGRRRRRVGGASEVAMAAGLAAAGEAFEVEYYPAAAAAEFVVRAVEVEAAAGLTRETLFPGAKVRMDFEDSVDPTLNKSCSGTIASIQASDPIHFPSSPWRMVTVAWDSTTQADQRSAVSHVNPWSISIESNIAGQIIPAAILPRQYALAVQTQPSQSPPHNNNTNNNNNITTSTNNNNNIKSSQKEQSKAAAAAEEERGPSSSVTSDTPENKQVWLFGINIASTTPKKAPSGSPTAEEITAPAAAEPEIHPQTNGRDDTGAFRQTLEISFEEETKKTFTFS